MRKHWGAAILILAMAGCAAPTGEAAFIDQMKEHVRPPVDSAGKETGYDGFVEIGREVCASEDSAAEVTESWAAAGFRPEEATALVKASVETLCPDRKAWLGG
jgi:hypothetical protein